MQIQSFAHLDLILNGHRFEGWANEDPPIDWEFDDLNEVSWGQDGGVYLLSKPMFGGYMTVKVFDTSPTAQWLMQQRLQRDNALIDKAEVTVFSGSFGDAVQGSSWELSGGWLENVPLVAMPHVTFAAKIGFERITPNVDGGTYRPPLATDFNAGSIGT